MEQDEKERIEEQQTDILPEDPEAILESEEEDGSEWNLTLLAGGGIAIVSLVLILAVLFLLKPFQQRSRIPESTVSAVGSQADLIEVPDITGMTEEAAEQVLSAQNLGMKYRGEKPSSEAAGTIISQSPEAGSKTAVNATVSYIRSSGPSKQVIPEVENRYYAEARLELEEKGFVRIETEFVSSSKGVGRVLSVSPSPDARVSSTDPITLTVSKGEKSRTARPENYLGMPMTDAVKSASKSGLIAEIAYGKSSLYDSGQVMKQDIDPDAPVASGSVIVLTVCDGTPELSSGLREQTVVLGQPASWSGGTVRFVLEYTEADESCELLLSEDETPVFPYSLSFSVPQTAADGVLRMYESDGTSYIRVAFWDISF